MATHTGEVGHDTLREIVRRIVEVADPERIVVFGSAVRGEMLPDSDAPHASVFPSQGTMRMGSGVPDLAEYPDVKTPTATPTWSGRTSVAGATVSEDLPGTDVESVDSAVDGAP
ncbi:nucleotidyltransferase domain-containing protein [Candidatus Poribacteria bacterium]|jgi:hypothetical protein|nr:nucleotidyltransferase domain-containing protein [Candidatus Poribacteria bacterium]MBT5536018.1 nucleotidyltransferase domain-containing protein [Candidatus Poribacteria bacterium]MBT5710437.1 nucleotidyltransferase domain-containing protein [Candidatus Poribacteria bacterium]MBT7096543.1 nucleotidyltransferase domain-containing protein [Candidatus Poribacteria bacterium]MBT7808427.1 nucleotidyltransferase domain-containing protein [Candidatus Poribacteria bacterium]